MVVVCGTGGRDVAVGARDAGLALGRVVVCRDDATARNVLGDSIAAGDAVLALGIGGGRLPAVGGSVGIAIFADGLTRRGEESTENQALRSVDVDFDSHSQITTLLVRLHRWLASIAGSYANRPPWGWSMRDALWAASGSAARVRCFTMKSTSERRGGAKRRPGVSAETTAEMGKAEWGMGNS